MEKVNNILLKLLGILLLTAAILKGWQLLTEPVANEDIWSNRAFLIFTVEFELAFGIWLLSGLFKRAAWLAALGCFSMFAVITLYKGFSGADSCGCFGAVKVNPWITLCVIDLPAVIALLIFSPQNGLLSNIFTWRSHVIPNAVRNPQISGGFAAYLVVVILVLAITTSVLALNKPATVTSSYEVLEPETWIGKRLPIVDYIDIGKQLEKGNWLVLFYHHDCPDCQKAIANLGWPGHQFGIEKTDLKVAIIEMPPYGGSIETSCTYGRLLNVKEWFISTPAVVLMKNRKITQVWGQEPLDIGSILDDIFVDVETKGIPCL
jgi:hypothetical protein